MNTETEEKIRTIVMMCLADGFNRSINALSEAGALDLRDMRKHYAGVGSKFYDIVTRQMEITAQYAVAAIMAEMEGEGRR